MSDRLEEKARPRRDKPPRRGDEGGGTMSETPYKVRSGDGCYDRESSAPQPQSAEQPQGEGLTAEREAKICDAAFKAIRCLYIEVECSVAEDLDVKVTEAIKGLRAELTRVRQQLAEAQKERDKAHEILDVLGVARGAFGYSVASGLHSVVVDSVRLLIKRGILVPRDQADAAVAAFKERACRAVKPFEPDGADEIEIAIRALPVDQSALDAERQRVRLEGQLETLKRWHSGCRSCPEGAFCSMQAEIHNCEVNLAALRGTGG